MLSEALLMAELEYRQRRYLDEAAAYRLARQARGGAGSRQTRLAAVVTQLSSRRNQRDERPVDAAAGSGSTNSHAAERPADTAGSGSATSHAA